MTLNIWPLFYSYENNVLTLTFPRTRGLLFDYFPLLKPASEREMKFTKFIVSIE